MALEYLESFDDSLWASRMVNTNSSVNVAYGRNGKGIRSGDDFSARFTTYNPGGVHQFIGFAMAVNDGGTGVGWVMRWGANTGVSWVPSTGRIRLFVNGSVGGDYILDTPNAYALGTWHYVEVELIPGYSSDGTARMWVDGVLIGGSTTIDYQDGASGSIEWAGTLSPAIDNVYLDDIYVVTAAGDAPTDRLGPLDLIVPFPNNNGNSSDLLGSDGNKINNFENVDEDPPDAGTTYNGSAVEGDKDTYAMDDLTGTPDIVLVQTVLYGAKTGTEVKYLRPVIRSAGTDYPGASVGLPEAYGLLQEQTWPVDPATSAAWLYTAVNAAEIGAEVRDT